jgi:hypothetical protein
MDIANGAWHGRHFREQLVSERFGQPLDEVFGGTKMLQRRRGDAGKQGFHLLQVATEFENNEWFWINIQRRFGIKPGNTMEEFGRFAKPQNKN